MPIRTVITRGYGNGTFNGDIPHVVRRGYSAGAVTREPINGAQSQTIASQYDSMNIAGDGTNARWFIFSKIPS